MHLVGFARISDFPCVTGAIDGTRIPIKAPSLNGNVFSIEKKLPFNKCHDYVRFKSNIH